MECWGRGFRQMGHHGLRSEAMEFHLQWKGRQANWGQGARRLGRGHSRDKLGLEHEMLWVQDPQIPLRVHTGTCAPWVRSGQFQS